MQDIEDITPQSQDPITMIPKFLGGQGEFIEIIKEKERKKYIPQISSISNIEEDCLKNVFDAYIDLNMQIGKLDVKIADIIRRQKNDFTSSYKIEMEFIQNELKEMKKMYNDFIERSNIDTRFENMRKNLLSIKKKSKN